jgi:hypothetical protein
MALIMKNITWIFLFNGNNEGLGRTKTLLTEKNLVNRAMGTSGTDEIPASILIVNDIKAVLPGDIFYPMGVNRDTGAGDHPGIKFISSDSILTGGYRNFYTKQMKMNSVKLTEGVGIIIPLEFKELKYGRGHPSRTDLGTGKRIFIQHQGRDAPSLQFPGTGGTGRTASDDNDLHLNHGTPVENFRIFAD